jgi:hypothetical protein
VPALQNVHQGSPGKDLPSPLARTSPLPARHCGFAEFTGLTSRQPHRGKFYGAHLIAFLNRAESPDVDMARRQKVALASLVAEALYAAAAHGIGNL